MPCRCYRYSHSDGAPTANVVNYVIICSMVPDALLDTLELLKAFISIVIEAVASGCKLAWQMRIWYATRTVAILKSRG